MAIPVSEPWQLLVQLLSQWGFWPYIVWAAEKLAGYAVVKFAAKAVVVAGTVVWQLWRRIRWRKRRYSSVSSSQDSTPAPLGRRRKRSQNRPQQPRLQF